MPLYEYVCDACHHRFEILQRVGARGEGLACPRCGHAEVAKVYSTFAGITAGAAPAEGGCGQPQCCRLPGGGGCAS